jgi:hypothetical protein
MTASATTESLYLRDSRHASLTPALDSALGFTTQAPQPLPSASAIKPDSRHELAAAAAARLALLGLPQSQDEAYSTLRITDLVPLLGQAPNTVGAKWEMTGETANSGFSTSVTLPTEAWLHSLADEGDAAGLIALALAPLQILQAKPGSPSSVDSTHTHGHDTTELVLTYSAQASDLRYGHQAAAALVHIPVGATARLGLQIVCAGQNTLVNTCVLIQVERGATLDLFVTDPEGPTLQSLTRLRIRLEADATLRMHLGTTGNALSRTAVQVDLAGSGAHAEVLGTAALAGKRQAHRNVLIRHLAPQAVSRQLFKTVAADQSRSSVDGSIEVAKGAKGTQAGQTLRNLLLGDEARADSKPRLLIHNDDVKCNHGATTGQLDDAQRFYLRSRGLTDAQAVALLTSAFLHETLDQVEPGPHRSGIETVLRTLLNKAI